MEETELIALCRRGDLKAFESLILFHQQSVFSLASRILGDRDEARDAAQDAFAQAFFHIHAFDPQRSFRSWLLGIAAKRCLDRLRRRKSFFRFLHQYAGFIQLSDSQEQNDDKDFLKSLMGALNERERIAVSLMIDEEMSIDSIAEIMGCSASTVRVHLFNARKKLRTEVKKHV